MEGLRRTSKTAKASDGLARLSVSKRSATLVGSKADRKKRRLASATQHTRNAARTVQYAGGNDDLQETATTAETQHVEFVIKAEVQHTKQAAKNVVGKVAKRSLISTSKRHTTLKAAKNTKNIREHVMAVRRIGAAVARSYAATVATIKSLAAAISAVASSTPVLIIVLAILAALIAFLSIFSWIPGMTTTTTTSDRYGYGGNYPVGTAPGPWGGYQNGRLPTNLLAPIPWQPNFLLRSDATAALTALNEKYKSTFGTDLYVSDAYRDYAGQVAIRGEWCARGACHMAAVPGTSNHGWALAVDLGGGINSFGTPQYEWMKNHGPAYGWQHPAWAEPGGSGPTEPWHWEFWGWADPAMAVGSPSQVAKKYAQAQIPKVFPNADTPYEFACLDKLWTNESGWNPNAENPSSHAYGIPQALPGAKMATAGADWQTNPQTQVTWGLNYIRDRYGTPCQAWNVWQNNTPHWY